MTKKTLGAVIAESFSNGKRTYSYDEEGDMFFPESIFLYTIRFGSATVMGRGKDLDYLTLVPDLGKAFPYLLTRGWEYTGTEEQYLANPQQVEFQTFRFGCYNLVVVSNAKHFRMMVKANDPCVRLKLANRNDRIAVFDSICAKGEL